MTLLDREILIALSETGHMRTRTRSQGDGASVRDNPIAREYARFQAKGNVLTVVIQGHMT